jgi:unsaturated rhamnogalacturonyl hydrolase
MRSMDGVKSREEIQQADRVWNIDKSLIQEKLDRVIEKLMNLGGPENREELAEGGEAIGFFKRDFGIREWDWPQGVGLYGLLRIMQARKNEDYKEFLYQWFKDNMKEGLPSKNINTTTPLLTLAELNEYYHDQEFEALCLTWADWLMNCLPRTRERGFQHVTSANGDRQGVRLNENEMWIDTIFMTVLFLNRMGQKYRNQAWIDESIHQVLMHIKYLCDKETGLFYHGWTFNERNNFGGIFWCRGNSWFTLGILDYIDMFKGTMNAGVKEFVVDAYKAQAEALKGLQGKSGLWHTVLTDRDSYEEVSGSAAITAGILKGIRYGILDDSYLPCAWKAVKAILDNIDRDGTVLNVSGGTGMGYDADHYKNILIAPMAYGQSLTILALAEALLHLD